MKEPISRILKSRNTAVLMISLLIAGLAHGINMFGFPYFESDEGTYMSQAWAVVNQGKLTPYTYWFDHPPAGWLFIALWNILTGGFYTFGFSLNSGRVFMLILHLASTFLLYLTAKKITKNELIAIFTILFFSLSPLNIYYHRRILLDNIGVFWMLLSLYTLLLFLEKNHTNRSVSKNISLKVSSLVMDRTKDVPVLKHFGFLILSSLFYGISILTKETFLIFFPGFVFILLVNRRISIKDKLKTFPLWGIVLLLVLITYPLYAYSKGQLFENSDSGISLIDTIKFQLTRGQTDIFDLQNSFFWRSFREWMKMDPITILLGFISSVGCLLVGYKHKNIGISALFYFLFLIFLFRGALVFEFYIIPVLPFIALNSAYFLWLIIDKIMKRYTISTQNFTSYGYISLSLLTLLTIQLIYAPRSKNEYNIYKDNQTYSQVESVKWISSNIPANTINVIDNYAFIELNDRFKRENTVFDYYWKIDTDPNIKYNFYNNSYKTVDYIIVTPQMNVDVNNNDSLSITREALHNSTVIERFERAGWYVEIRTVKK
jgi:4-amino-4-deoxy-L-arabinose transferase-like glycosyltransferase